MPSTSVKRQRRNKPTRRRRKKNIKKRRFVSFRRFAFVLFCAIIVFSLWQVRNMRRRAFFYSFNDNEYSKKYFVRGVDVSHHNVFVNWNILRQQSITFVFMKSTEGISHRDRNYAKNYEQAKSAGLIVGTYHFYSFGVDGRLQAKHFINSSKVITGDLIPVIDVEHSASNKVARSKEFHKSVVDELTNLEKVLFEYYKVHPIIYTNKSCYKKYIEGEFPDNPLWICDLHGEPKITGDEWIIWQFSHSGTILGAIGNIDLNYYRYSFADFQKLLIP